MLDFHILNNLLLSFPTVSYIIRASSLSALLDLEGDQVLEYM